MLRSRGLITLAIKFFVCASEVKIAYVPIEIKGLEVNTIVGVS